MKKVLTEAISYIDCNEGQVIELGLRYKGDLNPLINEFYDGTKKPKIYEDLIEAIKKAKLHMSDWGK